MTIDELNALATLTAGDEIPVWDSEESGEPTKKITAQNMTASVKALGSLVNTSEMNDALAGKQNTLTFDTTPTTGSTNPVTSGGVADAIQQSAVNIIHYTTVDLSGTQINTAESGWYYATVDITSYIPNGNWVIGVAKTDNWDANVFITIYGRRDRIILTCPTQKTLGGNRRVILYYA